MRKKMFKKAAKTAGSAGSKASRITSRLFAGSRVTRPLPDSRAFQILMTGSAVSMFGSRISTIAFPLLVLHLNNSPLVAGLVAFAAVGPSMLMYIPAGALVDRWNPRRVMLVSELLRGVAIASVVCLIAILGRRASVVLLVPAMVAEDIFEIFSTLADRRYLSRLMERDKITSSQAYIEVRAHAVVLAGRPIGPFLFSIRPLLPFLADALSFCFSIGSLVRVRGCGDPVRQPDKVTARQLFADVRAGFVWLLRDRRSAFTVTFMSITSLIAQALIMIFLSEPHTREFSTVAIGAVLAASGAGGALGSIFARFLPPVVREHWLPIQIGCWCVALASLAMTGGLSVWWSAVAMSIIGFTGAIGNIEFGTYLVTNVADNMLARVTSIGQVLAIGACALGPVLGGAAIQSYGPRGAITLLLLIVALSPAVLWLGRGVIQGFHPAVSSANVGDAIYDEIPMDNFAKAEEVCRWVAEDPSEPVRDQAGRPQRRWPARVGTIFVVAVVAFALGRKSRQRSTPARSR